MYTLSAQIWVRISSEHCPLDVVNPKRLRLSSGLDNVVATEAFEGAFTDGGG